MKCSIWTDIEALFWGGGLCECVRNVSAKNEEILTGGDCVEETGAGLVNTICVRFVENRDLARTRGPVADAACFLATVKCFDAIGPDKIEDRIILVDLYWVTKHALCIVLVELEEFGCLPVVPVGLFNQLPPCEGINPCYILTYTTGLNNVVRSCPKNS